MIVYTTIFNTYEQLKPPPVHPPNTKFVCYTDNLLQSRPDWELRRVLCRLSPNHCARFYKIMSSSCFPDTEVTIWHAGNVTLQGNLSSLAALVENADIAVLKHPERNCVYEEVDACIKSQLDNPNVLFRQQARYRLNGYPSQYGLSMTFLIVRRNTARVQQLEEAWWREIELGSVLDHLSFDYSCRRAGIRLVEIPGTVFSGPYHKWNGRL